jgi:hypothetical protein
MELPAGFHWSAAARRVSLEYSLPEVVLSDTLARLRTALAGHYQLERELTGGAMSRVFVATESSLGRQVVIKVLPPELTASLSADRFPYVTESKQGLARLTSEPKR